MARIRLLPPTLVNQIAAGEVIERPASVLKELLENSIDAGSSRIDIEVGRGGIDLIQVADDGGGIHPDDLPLAFASHATSKLQGPDDLFRVGTLGFRGEALASVGSVAQVTLQSRPPKLASGAAVACQGGELGPVQTWNGAPGTRVEVRHLFYNVPARRKFLRGPGTEMAHITEAFTRVALGRLGLHLSLRQGSKLVHEVPGPMGLLDRIGLLFGAEVAGALYMVEGEGPAGSFGGYVGDPSCDQGTPALQYLYVNGRWVRDRKLFQAVQEAYQGLLMTGRYPVAFLFLDVPADQVDVNVHPAKAEVHFRDPQAVYRMVRDAVGQRLHQAELTAKARLGRTKEASIAHEVAAVSAPRREIPELPLPPAAEAPPVIVPAPSAARYALPTRRVAAGGGRTGSGPQVMGSERLVPSPQQGPTAVGTAATAGPVCKAIQVLDCFLIVEAPPDEVLVIDQHALHERVLFERLHQRLEEGRVESQRLLVPQPVDLPPVQAALVREHREALAGLGLEVEDFGGATLAVTGYPAPLGKRPPTAILKAVADHLSRAGRAPNRKLLLYDLLSLMACHSAVRAGDRLTAEEIGTLVCQRHLARDGHHCPHGRPTTVVLTRRELEKLFKRV